VPRLAALAPSVSTAADAASIGNSSSRHDRNVTGQVDDQRHEHERADPAPLPPASVPWVDEHVGTGLERGLGSLNVTNRLEPDDASGVGLVDQIPRTPRWKEMAAGLKASVAANASGLKGRPVWLMTNGRSVRSRRVAHWCSSSGTERTAVPRLARQPAEAAATASSTSSHGPNGATRMGHVDSEPRAERRIEFRSHAGHTSSLRKVAHQANR